MTEQAYTDDMSRCVVVARSTARTTRPPMTSPTPLVAGTTLRGHHPALLLLDEPGPAAAGSFVKLITSSCLGRPGGCCSCSDSDGTSATPSSSLRGHTGKKNHLLRGSLMSDLVEKEKRYRSSCFFLHRYLYTEKQERSSNRPVECFALALTNQVIKTSDWIYRI
jgi:hypothetical protein